MTDDLVTFPEPNLNGSAYPWARAVQNRIADRERAASQHEDRIKTLGQSVIALQRVAMPRFNLAKAFKGDWVAPTPGYMVASLLEQPSLAAGVLPTNFTASDGATVGTDTNGSTVSAPDSGNAIEFPNPPPPGGSGSALPGFVEWTFAEPLPGGASTYTLRFAWAYRPTEAQSLKLTIDGIQVWASPLGAMQTGWPVVSVDVPAGATVARWEHDVTGSTSAYAWIEAPALYAHTPTAPSGGVEYLTGDLVRHNGKIWVATAGETGTGVAITDEPSATSTAWTLLADSGQVTGPDSDIYRPTGIQAGGSAGSGGGYFGLENHGYGANLHSGIYLFEGYLDFIASNDADNSNTELVQDNQSFSLYATDPSGAGHPLLEVGLDAHTHVPYARILGVEASPPGEQHDFGSAGQWTVNHSIGRIPSVTVYDDAGNLLLAEAAATSTQVVITFANPTAGSVVLT